MTSRDKKKTIHVRAQVSKTDSLRFLWGKLPSFYQDLLELNYGKIAHLLCVPVQIEAITCLAQFYDPPLRCFTFQDFQLAPTIEKFSHILRSSKKTSGPYRGIGKVVKINDLSTLLGVPDLSAYYKTDTEIHGFNRSPLEKIAQVMVDMKKWDNLVDLLALLIFGLIMFPNLENFIDDAPSACFGRPECLTKTMCRLAWRCLLYLRSKVHQEERTDTLLYPFAIPVAPNPDLSKLFEYQGDGSSRVGTKASFFERTVHLLICFQNGKG